MRHMREHEALWAYGGINLFCLVKGFTKQILKGVFGVFCLILPHMPHVFNLLCGNVQTCRAQNLKNMRLMREHEDRGFKGFYLFRIFNRVRPNEKYEADMRIHEAHPHIFGASKA